MNKQLTKLIETFRYVGFLLVCRISVRIKIFVVALIAMVPIYLISTLPDGRLHIYVFDVGQGDAILIQLPTGEHILVDTGQEESILTHLGARIPFNNRHIEATFVSHPQRDHMGMLPSIVDKYSIGRLFINVPEWYRVSDEYHIKFEEIGKQSLYAGDSFVFNDVSMKVVWPPKELETFENLDINYNSHVFYLEYFDFRMLFTGDAEIGDDAPFRYDTDWQKIDVLKVPHHGSKNAVDAVFLESTEPSLAVISVGNNRFGHPDIGLIDLFQTHGVPVLRTDYHGSIHIIVDRHGWRVVR